jgi:hypothetical protein
LSRGANQLASRLIDVALEHAPGDRERFESLRLSIRRRLGIIHACEVSLKDQVKALRSLGERALSKGQALMGQGERKEAATPTSTPPSEAA